MEPCDSRRTSSRLCKHSVSDHRCARVSVGTSFVFGGIADARARWDDTARSRGEAQGEAERTAPTGPHHPPPRNQPQRAANDLAARESQRDHAAGEQQEETQEQLAVLLETTTPRWSDAAPSLRHPTALSTPSNRPLYAIQPPSLRHPTALSTPSNRPLYAIQPPSLRHPNAPSLRHPTALSTPSNRPLYAIQPPKDSIHRTWSPLRRPAATVASPPAAPPTCV
ncbi:unnamed protein product [Closterium sp. Yama58-4]|nr:unnamed protein product [Closterium sp. Yama58-4]